MEYWKGSFCMFYGAFAKIYTLSDEYGNVFYVGCATQDLAIRLKLHLTNARACNGTTNRKKDRLIRALEYKVVIKEVDSIWVTGSDRKYLHHKARHLESDWILKFHLMGYKLTNINFLRSRLATVK